MVRKINLTVTRLHSGHSENSFNIAYTCNVAVVKWICFASILGLLKIIYRGN